MFELRTLQEDESRELHTLLLRAGLDKADPPSLREATWRHLARRTVAQFSSEKLSSPSEQEEVVALSGFVAGRDAAVPLNDLPTMVRRVLASAACWIGPRSAKRYARLGVGRTTHATDAGAAAIRRIFGHQNLACGPGSERNVATFWNHPWYEKQLSFTWHRELTAALPGWRDRAGSDLLREDPEVVVIGELLEAAVASGYACIASFGDSLQDDRPPARAPAKSSPSRRIGQTEDGRAITMVATRAVGDHILRGSLLVDGVRVRHEVKELHINVSNSGSHHDSVDSEDAPDAALGILSASVKPHESITFSEGSDKRGRYFQCRFGSDTRGTVYNTVVSLRNSATYRYYPDVPCWAIQVDTYQDTSS